MRACLKGASEFSCVTFFFNYYYYYFNLRREMLDKRKMGLMILRKNRAVVWLFGKCVCWLFCFVMKLNITHLQHAVDDA